MARVMAPAALSPGGGRARADGPPRPGMGSPRNAPPHAGMGNGSPMGPPRAGRRPSRMRAVAAADEAAAAASPDPPFRGGGGGGGSKIAEIPPFGGAARGNGGGGRGNGRSHVLLSPRFDQRGGAEEDSDLQFL